MYEALVIGASAGGFKALTQILSNIPKTLPFPIIIVLHRALESNGFLHEYLNRQSALKVVEAEAGQHPQAGWVYIAAPAFHLEVAQDKTLRLTQSPAVNFSIPSIDLLFQSAALAYQDKLIGLVMTGANVDGAEGLKAVKENGGFTIVESPESAEFPYMPRAALRAVDVDKVATLKELSCWLNDLSYE